MQFVWSLRLPCGNRPQRTTRREVRANNYDAPTAVGHRVDANVARTTTLVPARGGRVRHGLFDLGHRDTVPRRVLTIVVVPLDDIEAHTHPLTLASVCVAILPRRNTASE